MRACRESDSVWGCEWDEDGLVMRVGSEDEEERNGHLLYIGFGCR